MAKAKKKMTYADMMRAIENIEYQMASEKSRIANAMVDVLPDETLAQLGELTDAQLRKAMKRLVDLREIDRAVDYALHGDVSEREEPIFV